MYHGVKLLTKSSQVRNWVSVMQFY